MKTLKDLPFSGKRVLLRVDFNVPLNKDGSIADDSRIRASLPTIQHLLKEGASIILMSHLGRPTSRDPKLTLAPCAKRLSELLHLPVLLAPDCTGPAVEKLAAALQPGQILLLENLRFHPHEEKPEPAFVQSLAKLGDLYVNDAFGTAHRAHASTALIAKHFPNKCAAGFLMEKEIAALTPLLHNPKRPFHAIIGGAKVSSKIGLIQTLLQRVDVLFLGGAMAYTFLKAQGKEMGDCPVEMDQLEVAKNILGSTEKAKLRLPVDLVIANKFSEDTEHKVVKGNVPAGWQGMDIGPQTAEMWSKELKTASTVFWNGPLGVTEMNSFAKGTEKIATTLAELNAQVIVGGGDSIAAIEKMKLASHFTHLSTGGGASLEFLEFGHLPGIDALYRS